MEKTYMKVFVALAMLVTTIKATNQREYEHLTRCIHMAKPLVQNPEFIFPLSIQDIRGVCRMWDGFRDCVNEFTSTYLSVSEMHKFNKAIRSSIESIHQLCEGDPEYQNAYLNYASCLKRVSVETCGGEYTYLADLVQGESIADAQLCCAHYKFRDCALDKTTEVCEKDVVPSGSDIPISRFMRDMLDRTLGFLLQKCRDYIPNSRDCPRTNVNPPAPTPAVISVQNANSDSNNEGDDFFIGSNGKENGVDTIGNNIYLRPDSTTSRPSSTAFPKTTTRFTWTTKASGLSGSKPTSSDDELSGNDVLEPESQQYRGNSASAGAASNIAALLLSFVLPRAFRLQ